MMQTNRKKRIVLYGLLLLLFLCAVPAVSHAAGQQSALPEPMGTMDVPPGTTVASLRAMFGIPGTGETLAVWKADGSVRESGPVETGDLFVLTGARGSVDDCETIRVAGSEPGSSLPESEKPPDGSASSLPDSSLPEPDVSSGAPAVPQSGEPSPSSPPASSGSRDGVVSVFAEPVTVAALQATLDAQGSADADRAVVTSADGVRRESGYVCTGDHIAVLDKSGETSGTATAVVLGDLTRCGGPTRDGCGLLYNYLTNRSGLDADLRNAADMNRDGCVDTADLLSLKKKLDGSDLTKS